MDSIGLDAVVAVLAVGVAVGLWRRRVDGRLRPVTRPAPAGSAGPAVPVRSVTPDVDETPGVVSDVPGTDREKLDPGLLAALGVASGQATLLQFSSAFCAPCRAVRRVSAEVAGMVPGVQHVEVDAESHLDAVRALDIWRTPTLLVLAADGRVSRRATGVPSKAQLIAAIGELESMTGDK
jgi:thiol-disulfide isomerase/thioredoxin